MTKWADYLISGVWRTEKNNSKYISSVMLHQDSETTFDKGVKKSKDEVISLIKQGSKIITIRWDYSNNLWVRGSYVSYEKIGGEEYLRSDPDSSQADNLENLLRMSAFI